MAKYNVKREPVVKKATTHQGGVGYTQKPEVELVGILSTGMGNSYYESEGAREKRFKELIDQIAKKDKVFAAKAMIYARTVFGQRSVSHFGSVELLPHLSGDALGKRYFTKRDRKRNKGGIVYRLDDMTEILGAYFQKNGPDASIPNSIKKGFREAIENADAYELAKYQMKGKSVSLVDIVNLVHPRETEKNGVVDIPAEVYEKAIKGTKWEKELESTFVEMDGTVEIPALRALVLGILKQFNTVEDKNTEAGKEVAEKVKSGEITKEQAEVELNEKKTENYGELIKTKKIGYLALLRNLRNIIKTGQTELLDEACELLVEPKFIRKSLVWPHQIDLALEVMLTEFSGRELQKVSKALGEAYELSIPNLQELLPPGRTAVVFDSSGSMEGARRLPIGPKQSINSSPAEKAALIAATFAKGIGADVYHFADRAKEIKGWNPTDSVNTIKREFLSHNGEVGYGTNFASSIELMERDSKQYDRIVIVSDCQDGYGWHSGSIEDRLKSYSKKFGHPYVYIIDVTGYSVVSGKPGQKVFRMQGYTQDIYEKIPQVEINPQVVIDEINAIEI